MRRKSFWGENGRTRRQIRRTVYGELRDMEVSELGVYMIDRVTTQSFFVPWEWLETVSKRGISAPGTIRDGGVSVSPPEHIQTLATMRAMDAETERRIDLMMLPRMKTDIAQQGVPTEAVAEKSSLRDYSVPADFRDSLHGGLRIVEKS